ncbi:hypothetical protein KC19_12G140200, partial [Ceratodon purpureus]
PSDRRRTHHRLVLAERMQSLRPLSQLPALRGLKRHHLKLRLFQIVCTDRLLPKKTLSRLLSNPCFRFMLQSDKLPSPFVDLASQPSPPPALASLPHPSITHGS